jgi:hypothetical protein
MDWVLLVRSLYSLFRTIFEDNLALLELCGHSLKRDLALIKRYPKDVYIIKCPAFPDITPLSR